MKLRSFLLRTATALVLVAVMLAAILWGPYSFAAFFLILTTGILWEYYHLVNGLAEINIYRPLHCFGGALIFFCAFCVSSHLTDKWILQLYVIYLMAMFISRLYSKQKNPMRELAYILMGQIYIAYPIAMLSALAFHTLAFPLGEVLKDYSPLFVLSLFFFIWINDTGAYLTGMTFGKRRLFPRISPKKSWEGFWGGLAFAMLLGWGLSYETVWNFLGINLHDGLRLTTVEWILMGLIVSVASTFGDLIESLVKRAVGVKDSGNILPGHGGLWDRFDSLIMAAPAMLGYLVFVTLLHQ